MFQNSSFLSGTSQLSGYLGVYKKAEIIEPSNFGTLTSISDLRHGRCTSDLYSNPVICQGPLRVFL